MPQNEESAEHTAGPWEALHDYDGDYGIFGGPNRYLIAVTNADREEDAANARLIAAAPQMLEALNEFVAYSECHCTSNERDCAYCLGDIAIRAAKGVGNSGEQ